jgi:hypothetical protein
MRTYEIDNVDSSLSYLNQDVQDGLNGRTYNEIFNETMTNLKIKGTVNKVRSNAVRGFEKWGKSSPKNLFSCARSFAAILLSFICCPLWLV